MNSIAKSFLHQSIVRKSHSSAFHRSSFRFLSNNSTNNDNNNSTNNDNNKLQFIADKPTLAYAKIMPQSYSSMKHEQILQLCVEGSQPARREALIRNIMSVDSIEYDQATQQVNKLAQINRSYMQLEYSPYHFGMGGAILSGAISFPLVFDKSSVIWFNNAFVTAEMPPVEDLETLWEVGSWSWGWMEPVIGQASFVLLLLQFARSQAMKLGLKPYGDYMLHKRSKRLVEAYPQYNPMFLDWFAESEALYGNTRLKE